MTPNSLVFKRHTDGFFKIDSHALEVMSQFIQYKLDCPESGGVLLGRHILNTNNIVVDQVTVPMIEDRQARDRFFRSRKLHQQIINQAWQESEGRCTYLGEWHTHPEPFPIPSFIDKLDWRRKLMFDHFSGCIFFVVVGTQGLRVWEGYFRRLNLMTLEKNV